jgi:hypothetical protein
LPAFSLTTSTSASRGRPDRDGGRDRHAALAGRAEGRRDEVVGGEVEVGVGQHDRVVLGAAEGLHPLAGGTGLLVDVAGDRGGPDERHRAMPGWSRIASTATLSPCTDVEDAVRQAGLLPEPGDELDTDGSRSLGLSTNAVAAGDRDRVHPHRHHDREVERGDPGADPERLADRVEVDAGGDLVGVVALEQGRQPAGELDHLEPALTSPRASESTLPCSSETDLARACGSRAR